MWMSLNFLTSSCEMDRSILDVEQSRKCLEMVLSHVSDVLFSVRNALFSSREPSSYTWMSLTFSREMDRSIPDPDLGR